MSKDFAEFLDALNRHDVSYVVIEGIAVGDWGGFEPQYSPEDFISGDILSFGGLLRVEIHSNVPGATWNSVWSNRIPGELSGIPTHFAGLDDLISMKKAAGRSEKDLPDLRRLEKLKASSTRK